MSRFEIIQEIYQSEINGQSRQPVVILSMWAVCINGGFNLFGGSLLCDSSHTWNIGSTWCRHINGDCQMADNRIHHTGGTIAYIWWWLSNLEFMDSVCHQN
jgi:hypothetical protein